MFVLENVSSFESSKAGLREEMNHEGINHLPFISRATARDGIEANWALLACGVVMGVENLRDRVKFMVGLNFFARRLLAL